MPIEIKELVVRATVDETARRPSDGEVQLDKETRRQIISECIEQVVTLLERKAER